MCVASGMPNGHRYSLRAFDAVACMILPNGVGLQSGDIVGILPILPVLHFGQGSPIGSVPTYG
jgi:hypothetical protein